MNDIEVERGIRAFECFLCHSPQQHSPTNASNASDEFGIQLAKYAKVLNILNFPHSLPQLYLVRSNGNNCCSSCFQGLSQLWDFHELIQSIRNEMKEIVNKLTPPPHCRKQTINNGMMKPPLFPPPALVPLNQDQSIQFQETTTLQHVGDYENETEGIAYEPLEEIEDFEMTKVKLENMDEFDENEMDDLLEEEEQKVEIPSGCTVSVTLPQSESPESPSKRPSRSSKTKAISLIRIEAAEERKTDYQEDIEYRPDEDSSSSNHSNDNEDVMDVSGNHSRPVPPGLQPRTCDICGVELCNSFSLTRHRFIVHKIKPPSTLNCVLNWNRKRRCGIKKVTLSTTISLKSFKCTKCSRKFDSKGSLNKHTSHSHKVGFLTFAPTEETTADKTIKGGEVVETTCNVCGIPFNSEYSLRVHRERVHEKLQNHKCHICGKGFYLKLALDNHVRTHLSEKPFQCTNCFKYFTSLQGLRNHQNKHHPLPLDEENDVETLD